MWTVQPHQPNAPVVHRGTHFQTRPLEKPRHGGHLEQVERRRARRAAPVCLAAATPQWPARVNRPQQLPMRASRELEEGKPDACRCAPCSCNRASSAPTPLLVVAIVALNYIPNAARPVQEVLEPGSGWAAGRVGAPRHAPPHLPRESPSVPASRCSGPWSCTTEAPAAWSSSSSSTCCFRSWCSRGHTRAALIRACRRSGGSGAWPRSRRAVRRT